MSRSSNTRNKTFFLVQIVEHLQQHSVVQVMEHLHECVVDQVHVVYHLYHHVVDQVQVV